MSIFDRMRNMFAKPPALEGAPGQALFAPYAVDTLANLLFALPDPDEVLRKVGKNRAALRELLVDDEIATAVDTRRDALLGTPWRLEGDGDSDSERVTWLHEQVERHFEDLITGAWEANLFGYSVMELVWQKEGARYGIAEATSKPFEWFIPQRERNGLRFLRPGGGDMANGVPVDTTFKFLLTTRQFSYRNPRGEALLSRCYWPWFMRSQGWRFWSRFLERFGAPLLVGHTSGSVKEMRDALLQAVQSSVVAVSGTDSKVEAISPGNAGEAFNAFCERVDKRIQKVILGQTLTTDSNGKGSYAQAKVHDGVRQDRKLSDIRLVSPTVQRFVAALSVVNFPGAPVPRFIMEDGEGLATDRATRDSELVKSGVLRLTEQYLLDRYDFTRGDFVVPDAPALPSPGPAARQPAPQDDDDQDDDTTDPQFRARGPTQFAAGRRGRFTADQERVEDLVDSALAKAGSPISAEALRAAVFSASSPQDLTERLVELARDANPVEFRELMERTLFAADLIGYQHADPKR